MAAELTTGADMMRWKRACAGRVAVGGAALGLALMSSAACSGGHDGPGPKRAATPKASAVSGGSGAEDTDEETSAPDPDDAPGVDFWARKVDMAVFLCRDADTGTGGCANGAVTNAQREEILAALKNMPQIQHVFYENQTEALRHYRALNANNPRLLEGMTVERIPESFRIKLKDPATRFIVVTAMEGRPGVASTAPQAPAAPPRPGSAAARLTQEQARRAVLTVDDLGPGWTAGAVTDTGSKPASEPYSGRSGNAGCDRALAGVPAGAVTIALGAQRVFENGNGLRVTASVQVYDDDDAALQLAKTRAMLAGCSGIPLPYQGTVARFGTLPAPALGEETLGMRVIVEHDGPRTLDAVMIRIGPDLVGITVAPLADDATMPAATLERLARRATELLRTTAGS
ncbi:permease-like cell division protein FtsX [Embleya sp. NPDC020630]|uniref:permease-like cell division protein FtsX n=1 Tax=Embleya sp. NPDC020630 TaxID=3363979 RepID=UPI0037B3CB1E